jgi:hypothetical protein
MLLTGLFLDGSAHVNCCPADHSMYMQASTQYAVFYAGALLWDVRNCSEMRKDGPGIARLLFEMGTEIMGGPQHTSSFGGWTVDNTRSNMKALRLLEVQAREWINVGCIAHGTALAMKDLCKVQRTTGRYSSVWGNKILAETVEQANTVANFIQDSSSAKTLLHRHQVAIYGRRRDIEINVPTRFATHFHVMKSINNSSAALKQAASDQAWLSLDGKSAQVCPSQDISAVVNNLII